ncbi:MAG: hypothetical protein J6X66_12835, partial [Lachnospiraceae bacterium]|nr:hypothetical protein [Lachnospiraceae bacterium]
AWLTPLIMSDLDDSRPIALYFCLIGAAIFRTWSVAVKKYKAMLVSIGLTRSGTTSRYVSERAGR